jgi:hypothetical protein
LDGALISHTASVFDAQGRPTRTTVFDPSGPVIRTISLEYDGCGDVTSRETREWATPAGVSDSLAAEYAPDGLVRRLVTISYGQCKDQSYAYAFDANGRVTTISDPYSCKTIAELAYDEIGHVARVASFDASGMFLGTGPVSVKTFSYHPNGVLKQVQWTSEYGYHYDHQYDEQGRPIDFDTNQTGGSTIDDRHRQWKYDVAGRLSEFTEWFSSIVRCAIPFRGARYEYDQAGKLLRVTEQTSANAQSCAPHVEAVERVTAYTHPSPSVTVAEVLDKSGAPVERTTTTVDGSGREIRRTDAAAPSWMEGVLTQRDYSCVAGRR